MDRALRAGARSEFDEQSQGPNEKLVMAVPAPLRALPAAGGSLDVHVETWGAGGVELSVGTRASASKETTAAGEVRVLG